MVDNILQFIKLFAIFTSVKPYQKQTDKSTNQIKITKWNNQYEAPIRSTVDKNFNIKLIITKCTEEFKLN